MTAFLHATEGRLGHRNPEAVDANHAGLDLLAEQIDRARRTAERIGREPVRQAVRLLDDRLEARERIHDGDGSERLLIHDAGRVRHIRQHGRLPEVAFAVQPRAAQMKAGAGGLRVTQQSFHCRHPARVRERPHLRGIAQAVPYAQRLGTGGEAADETLVDLLVYIEASG